MHRGLSEPDGHGPATVVDTGKTAARLMLRLIDGEKVGHIMEEPYERRARESTGPAPAGR